MFESPSAKDNDKNLYITVDYATEKFAKSDLKKLKVA
jgi:ATP-dependent Clp protease ATP-binding subunit ClpX